MITITNKLEKYITLIEKVILIFVSLGLLSMSFLIAADTFMRYFMNKPIIGVLEITEHYFMVGIVYFGISATFAAGEHISINILTTYFPKKINQILEIILNLIAVLFFSVIIKQSWIKAIVSWETSQTTTGAVKLAVAPPYFFIVFGLLLIIIRMLIKNITIISEWKAEVKEG